MDPIDELTKWAEKRFRQCKRRAASYQWPDPRYCAAAGKKCGYNELLTKLRAMRPEQNPAHPEP